MAYTQWAHLHTVEKVGLTVKQGPWHILTLCVKWHSDLDIYWPCVLSYSDSDLNITDLACGCTVTQWPWHKSPCVLSYTVLNIYWPCMLSYSDLNIYWPCVLSYSDLNIYWPSVLSYSDLNIYWPFVLSYSDSRALDKHRAWVLSDSNSQRLWQILTLRFVLWLPIEFLTNTDPGFCLTITHWVFDKIILTWLCPSDDSYWPWVLCHDDSQSSVGMGVRHSFLKIVEKLCFVLLLLQEMGITV